MRARGYISSSSVSVSFQPFEKPGPILVLTDKKDKNKEVFIFFNSIKETVEFAENILKIVDCDSFPIIN